MAKLLKITPKQFLYGLLAILVVLLIGTLYHQHTHFNPKVTINEVPVGGLTAKQAFQKVRHRQKAIKVYVNNDLVYQRAASSTGFTNGDEAKFQAALKKQHTFFPSKKGQNIIVTPTKLDRSPLTAIDQAVSDKISSLNANRKPAKDAYAKYSHGTVKVIPAVYGKQFSQQGLKRQVRRELANGTIKLKPAYIKPLTSRSATVQNEKRQLDRLRGKAVTYQVQKQHYQFKTSDVIASATYQDGHYHFDTSPVSRKIRVINRKQATLANSFHFTTPDGQHIKTAAGGNYGWKISSQQAGATLAQAIASGKSTVNASADLTGKGFTHHGTGYQTTSNHGLGNTYAVVSIAKQHAWFYEKGKCVMSVNIVSGSDNKANRTPKGVWYIMYQQSPSVLRGQNDDGTNYASKVTYWSPFTMSGCGFHDASWRTDWSKDAYKKTNGGSHGCINMQPSEAGKAYHYLHINEPVIIY